MASSGPSSAKARRWIFGSIAGLICGAALAILGWRWGFERARDSGWLDQFVNRRADRLSVSWQEVESQFPGYLVARGLEIRGRTERRAWLIKLEELRGWFNPLRLARREIAFRNVDTRGLRVTVRSFDPADSDQWLRRLPRGPAPDLHGLELAPPRPLPAPKHPWGVHIERVRVEGPTELSMDGLELNGHLEANLGFRRIRREKLEVFPSTFRFRQFEIRGGTTLLAWNLAGQLRLESEPYPYRGAHFGDFLRASSVHLELKSGAGDGATVAQALLSPWPWVTVETGSSQLRGTMIWNRGVLQPPTDLAFSFAALQLRLLGFQVAGEAETRMVVVEPSGTLKTQVRLAVPNWHLGRPGGSRLAEGNKLEIQGETGELVWGSQPTPQQITVDLGKAHVPDLTVLNEYLPGATGFSIESGSGQLEGTISIAGSLPQSSGWILVEGRSLRFAIRNDRVHGTLRLELQMSHPTLDPPSFELRGSKIVVSGLQLHEETVPFEPTWWGELFVEEGRLSLSDPAALSGTFIAKAADTSPLVALYELKRDLPHWLERLLTVRNPTARVRLDWRPGQLQIQDARLVLAEGELRGRLLLQGRTRNGRLLAQWRRLRLGVELENEQRRLRLRDLDRWFDGAPMPSSEAVQATP